jgi:ribose/xylose/arabinose/galactoside ABC-type transport system permease subunit
MTARRFLARYGVVLALVLLVAGLAAVSPAFRTAENLVGIGRQVAILGIAAAAMTFVILAGEIDLSVGAVAGAAGVVAAVVLAAGGGWAAVPAALAVGLGFGLLNGCLVIWAGVPSFIATLVSFFIAQGVALTLTAGQTIRFSADTLRATFATGAVAGVSAAFLWLLVVLAVLGWALHRTRFGAHLYVLGGSAQSARMLGLAVDRLRVAVFALTGGLMGLVGLILISRIGNARADGAIGLEFDAIAAVVLGGTALGGGTGALWRSVAGVALIGVLNNGLAILNADFNVQQVVKGVLVIAVVLIARWTQTVERA